MISRGKDILVFKHNIVFMVKQQTLRGQRNNTKRNCSVSTHKIHIMVLFNFSLSYEKKIDKEKYDYGRFMNE